MNNFEKLYLKNRVINIVPKHCFELTLADFEQIINNVHLKRSNFSYMR